MAIDLRQFHQVFFEESFENLESMERDLLHLQVGHPDSEAINRIFRAAHSIKGGSATFGFNQIASVTHILETLLDEVREGIRSISTPMVDVLLQSVDGLRNLLLATQQSTPVDELELGRLLQTLKHLIDGDEPALLPELATEPNEPHTQGCDWRIRFVPYSHMLRSGNEPFRMFRELSQLGQLSVEVQQGALPVLADLQPLDCYLAWNLRLQGDVSEAQIRDVFEWVSDDADLELSLFEPSCSAGVEADTAKPNLPSVALVTPAELPLTTAAPVASAAVPVAAPVARESSTIRVNIEKVDSLINMVGELVITQSMLNQIGDNFHLGRLDELRSALVQLSQNTRELQENVISIRMMPISFVFNRFPRMVRDLAQQLDKQIELRLIGEQTELDKTLMEKIGDPLVHLVRNSIDHGLELPSVRLQAGKPVVGVIELRAYHQSGNILIEIRDDGAGLNTDKILAKARERGIVGPQQELTLEQIHQLIFEPGFSTADQVSDLSGRGVGMDVVRRNILSLGGSIDIASTSGQGCQISIRLPLTLAIMDGQLVRVGQQIYVAPLISVLESLQMDASSISKVAGKHELYHLRSEYIPILRLYQKFGVEPSSTELEEGLLIILSGDGQKVAVLVDELLSQQQVVIKSLETNFRRIDGVAGATILGDGTVSLILDVVTLIRHTAPVAAMKSREISKKKTAGDSYHA